MATSEHEANRDRARARGAERAAPGDRSRDARAGARARAGAGSRRRRTASCSPSEGWHPGRDRHRRVAHRRGVRPTDGAHRARGRRRERARAARSRAFDLHGGLGRVPRPAHALRRTPRGGGRHHRARSRRDEFARCFNAVARVALTPDDLVPELRVDLEVAARRRQRRARVAAPPLRAVRHRQSVAGARRARRRASPRRRASSARTASSSRLADRRRASSTRSAGAWAPRIGELDVGTPIDVAFRLERDEYQGESRLQARLADFRVPERDAHRRRASGAGGRIDAPDGRSRAPDRAIACAKRG